MLCGLFNKYRSPKAYLDNPLKYGHSYSPVYFSLLKNTRTSTRRVLEVGIGDVRNMGEWGRLFPDYKRGASLYGWRDFFRAADIYGIDNDRELIFNDGRIRCTYADQGKSKEIEDAVGLIGGERQFDLIVDDGAREIDKKITAALTLIKYVRPSGMYICEDIDSGYMDMIRDVLRSIAVLRHEHYGKFRWDNFLAFSPREAFALNS